MLLFLGKIDHPLLFSLTSFAYEKEFLNLVIPGAKIDLDISNSELSFRADL